MTNFHFGRATDILYTIVIQFQFTGNIPIEGDLNNTVCQPFHSNHLRRCKTLHSRRLDKSDRIPLKVSVIPIALPMHEAQIQSTGVYFLNGTQVSTVHIYRIILCTRKITTNYLHLSTTSGKVHHIRRSCQQPATAFARHTFHFIHCNITSVLTYYTKPMHIVHLHPVKCNIPTFENKPSHLVTNNVTNCQSIPHFRAKSFRDMETYYIRGHPFRLRSSKHIPPLTITESTINRTIFYTMILV